tara:strand:- start:212 stop:499 length:288 start_codon:yes stop_codon:yes gene_type:complete
VRLSKLTVARPVFRGISGGLLPTQFWRADPDTGVRGGVEPAFMSTTVDRSVAMSYASSGGGGATARSRWPSSWAMAGHHGLVRLHLEAWDGPAES